MSRTIRVLVVDDSAFFRKVLTTEIGKQPGFEVIGTASDGQSAIQKVRELKPDVVTLDIEMPVMSGLEALKVLVKEGDTAVIMVSAQTEHGAKVTLEALEAGAVDFIPKTQGAMFIREKIQAAADAAILGRGRRRRATAGLQPAAVSAVPARPAVTERRDIALVVIGSSTGGPQALTTLVRSLPARLSVPVVVAQHMPPHFTEALAKRLDQSGPVRVVHAAHGDKLAPGTIYIAPGGGMMRVTKGEIAISFTGETHLYRPSVDVLAASAIDAYGSSILGVLLTGMGADGAKELNRLHQIGGHTIAQDQGSCVVYGMPRALVEMGGAHEVLPIDAIGGRIGALTGSPLAATLRCG